MLHPAALRPRCRPLLLLVLDTEEEFDWSQPFSRRNRGVSWIRGLYSAHAAFAECGLRPTYVVDHPVATTTASAEALSAIAKAGEAEIGAHLHPWVTPPDVEAVTRFNSYGGNLPGSLELEKLSTLKLAIESNLGVVPTTFKAGRYGVSPRTIGFLEQLGFHTDLSTTPGFDWSGDGGPNHASTPNQPHWILKHPTILEIPTTGGYFGPLRHLGARIYPIENQGTRQESVVRWTLRKSGLLSRAMLTPEGYTLRELMRLTDTLLDDGIKVFSLSLHSPSLFPGNTPFVRDHGELAAFIGTVTAFARWFDREHRGQFVTASEARNLHEPATAP
jgi:hypothetical protein